jgi:hypothetical protein
MDLKQTNRRTFLTTFVTLAALPVVPRSPLVADDGGGVTISFFVAGVRFQPIITGLQVGSLVTIVRSDDEAISYVVRTTTGGLIGYVPKRLIPVAHDFKGRPARLQIADYDVVPWKRFMVAAKTASPAAERRPSTPCFFV